MLNINFEPPAARGSRNWAISERQIFVDFRTLSSSAATMPNEYTTTAPAHTYTHRTHPERNEEDTMATYIIGVSMNDGSLTKNVIIPYNGI